MKSLAQNHSMKDVGYYDLACHLHGIAFKTLFPAKVAPAEGQRGGCCHLYFINKKSEAQRSQMV